MNSTYIYIAYIFLFLSAFLLFFEIHKKFEENKVITRVINKYKDDLDKRIDMEAAFVSEYGSIENKSIFYKLDRMILTSGIKQYMPRLSGEKFLLTLILASALGLGIATSVTKNLFVGIFVGMLVAVSMYVFILALSSKTYNAIEDLTPIFVSLLSNHAKGSSDIVTIMQRTLPNLDDPIKGLVSQFLLDAEKTGNVDVAFDYMKESVENRSLATIIMNLKNCMHYQANYEEVLGQMMNQIAASLSAREERKNILFSMKLTLVVISIASVVIVEIIGAGIGVDVKEIMTGSTFGQVLLLFTGCIYLFVAVKLFGTDK